MRETSLLVVVPLLTIVSFTTRLLPFMIGRRLLKYSWLYELRRYLPGVIIFIVLTYELQDVSWLHYPFGLPSILAILIIVLVQKCWHKEIISIFIGCLVYAGLTWLAHQGNTIVSMLLQK